MDGALRDASDCLGFTAELLEKSVLALIQKTSKAFVDKRHGNARSSSLLRVHFFEFAASLACLLA